MRRFSTADVVALTGFPEMGLRLWIKAGVIEAAAWTGETGSPQDQPIFEANTAFALFVGSRYRKEDAPPARVEGVVHFLASVPLERVQSEIAAGRTMPVPSVLVNRAAVNEGRVPPDAWKPGMFVKPNPDDSSLALTTVMLLRRLDLKKLWDEFVQKT